jgi:tetratricopeptide (TPR) repeat protein
MAAEALAEITGTAEVLGSGQPLPPVEVGYEGGDGGDQPGGSEALSLSDRGPGTGDEGGGDERGEDERTGEAGAGEREEAKKPPAKPTARFLTITIVVASFIAALGGFLLNRASAEASNAGDIAQQLSLQGSAAETSAYQQAQTDYAQYLSLEALKAKAAQEMLEASYRQPGTQTWAALYQATLAQVKLTAQSVPADLHPFLANGNPDLIFPYDFFAQRASSAVYLEAKSDAYNDVSGKWAKLVDAYTAIVTMIAVALFLFGSAYVLYGRNRVIFTVLGGLLVGTGLVWGGGLAITRDPGTPSGAAARDYADGVTAMDQSAGPAGYQAAINDFTKAIKLRPDYALAYSERAAAEAYRGSQAIGLGFISNITPDWARLSDADEIESYQLGDQDASQTLSAGFGYYNRWFVNGAQGQPPGQAVDLVRKATALDPSNPVTWLDLGIAELATGRYQAAAPAFRAGVTHVLYTCRVPAVLSTCTTAQPPTSYDLQQAWLAGGMEALEDLAQTPAAARSSQLRASVARAKGMLVDSLASGQLEPGPYRSTLTVNGLGGFLDPNDLELQVPVPRGVSALAMSGMPLTVLWYEKPSGSNNWSAISETACWGHGHQDCGSYDARANSFLFTTRFLAADNQCFTNLDYRAELYVGGTLAGALSLGPKADYIRTNLAPALSKAMNVGICVPSTWHQQPLPALRYHVYGTSRVVSGPLDSSELWFSSPDHREGVYLFRLYPPRTLSDGKSADVYSVVESGAIAALTLLLGHGLPADLTNIVAVRPVAIWGPAAQDMIAGGYGSFTKHVEAFVGAAAIAPGGIEATPEAQDKAIAANVAGDYAVVVTIVYAPEGSAMWQTTHELGLQIFSSWSLLDYG